MAITITFPDHITHPALGDRNLYLAARHYADQRGLDWDNLSPRRRQGLMVSEIRHNAIINRSISGVSNPLGRYDQAMSGLPSHDEDYKMTRQAILNEISERWPGLLKAAVKQMF